MSGSEDASIRIWDLDSGDFQNVLEQDAVISCLLMSPNAGFDDKLVIFGDQVKNRVLYRASKYWPKIRILET